MKSHDLCFAGVGDGRNFFATLIGISKYETLHKGSQSCHITVNDLKGYSLAKILIVLWLAHELGSVTKSQVKEKAMILATMFYISIGEIMTNKVFARLRATMSKIVKVLENSDHVLGIDVGNCRAEIVRCLRV